MRKRPKTPVEDFKNPYPMRLETLASEIASAKRKTGISSTAEVLRQALRLGLPLLGEALDTTTIRR